MCLGIPGKVVETHREHGVLMGRVDFSGVSKSVCLEHVQEVKLGQYVLVHVGFALSIIEQRAILDFAARSPGLTAERSEELAEIAQSLTAGAPRGQAASRLVGIANYLMGRQ